MKHVFLVTFLLLVAWSAVAWWIQPDLDYAGKTPLVWISDDNPARKQQISLFNDLHPHHHLMLDPGNNEMEKVIVQSLAHVGPDLFDCYNGFQLSAYVKSGIAWDVTDQLNAAGVDAKEAVWSGVHPNMVHQGRVYGFPTNASADAIWLNKGLFAKAGVALPTGKVTRPGPDGKPVPDIWYWREDFLPLARKLTVRDEKGRAVQFGFLFDWWAWLHFIRQWGGRVYSEDGTRCVVDSPQTIAAVQFMQDLVHKYKVSPTPAEEAAAAQGGWGAGTITWFAAGKGAMALGGRWWLCNLRKATHPEIPADADEALRRTLQSKRLRLGAVLSPRQTHTAYRGYGRATLINRNSPRRQEALQFLLYMAGPEYNQLVNGQADGVGGVKKYVLDPAYRSAYLANPKFPEEDYNDVWAEAMARGVPDEVCPFVNGNAASRILTKQIDLVKAGNKTAAEAMTDAARKVNDEIAKTLRRDPSLRKRYRALTGRDRP